MYRGVLFLLLAELCFAATTVFVKLATSNTDIPAIEASFLRYLVGFIFTSLIIYKNKISIVPNNKRYVILRGVYNTGALIFFFLSIKYTSITNANMLNMTYPAFIFLIALLFTKEKTEKLQGLYLLLTMIGVYLIINPSFTNFNMGDLYGLLSGIIGALAIISLQKARQFDSTLLILFYLMAIGTVINGIILIPFFVMPGWVILMYLLASAILGVAGQAFLTSGYKHIEAAKGSIISGSRMIFAVFFGVLIFSETITIPWIIGGVLITISMIGISWKRKEEVE
jgi:drug/metabolite transporter (DMT)-like permease